jgi:hypothetical protein
MERQNCNIDFFIPHIDRRGSCSKKRNEIMKIKNFKSNTARGLLCNNFLIRLEEVDMFEESDSFQKYLFAEEQDDYGLLFDFLIWKEKNERFIIENEEYYLFHNL